MTQSMRQRIGWVCLVAIIVSWLLPGAVFALPSSQSTDMPIVTPVITPTPAPTPTPSPTPTPTPLPVYEDTLLAEQQAQPNAMVATEPIQVKLTLSNPASEPIGDIRICRDNGSLIAEVGTLFSESDPYLFSEPITPTDTQLDEGQIVYLIRYTLGHEKPGAKETERLLIVPLEKLPAEPGVEFTRTIPVSSLRQGEEAAIAYRIRNTGNVALTNLLVTDGKLGEVGTLDQLEPGERKTFIYRFDMDETITSKPMLEYSHRATRKSFEKELAASTLYLADELLDITLEADQSTVSPGGTVTLTCHVVNRGSVSYDHLRLSDQVQGDLGSLTSDLHPGQEYVFTKTVVMKNTTTFLFTLSGLSEGGSTLEAASNPLTVAVPPVADDVMLTLEASASTERPNGPGDIDFTLTITNEGSLDIRNVRLLEQTRGAIKTLAVAAPGVTIAEQQYFVSAPGQFVFMAELTDAKGGRLTVYSNVIDITFAFDGSTISTTEPDVGVLGTVTGAPHKLPDEPTTFLRMLVGVIGVLAVLCTCIAATTMAHRRKRRRLRDKHLRKLRRSFRREQQEDERQQTRPHIPVVREKTPPSSDSRRPGSLGRKNKEGK